MMKNLNLFLSIFLGMTLSMSACNKDDDNGDGNGGDNNNGGNGNGTTNTIPDTEFSMNVSGDMTMNFDTVIKAQAAQSGFAITGAHASAANLLTMQFREFPVGWGLNLNATAETLGEKTYKMNENVSAVSSFNNTASPQFTYMSTSGSVEITKLVKFAGAQGIEIFYADGTYTSQMISQADPSNTVTVSGSFKGVNISAN